MKTNMTGEDNILPYGINSSVVAMSDGTLLEAWEVRLNGRIVTDLTLPALLNRFQKMHHNNELETMMISAIFADLMDYAVEYREEDEETILGDYDDEE
jgi:hypothetical protein